MTIFPDTCAAKNCMCREMLVEEQRAPRQAGNPWAQMVGQLAAIAVGLLAVLLLSTLSACGGGGGGSDSATPPPDIAVTSQPADIHVLDGFEASFSIVVSGDVSYDWQRASGETWLSISGANQSTLALGRVSIGDDSAQFRVVVTSRRNGGNRITSSIAMLRVDRVAAGPSIAVQPVSTSTTDGQSARFFITATGSSLEYQWQRSTDGNSWVDIPGASSVVLLLPATADDDGAYVRVVISNSSGRVNSDACRLSVIGATSVPIFTTMPASVRAVLGQSATFTAVAVGRPAPTLNWFTSEDAGATWTVVPDVSGGSFTLVNLKLGPLMLIKAIARNDSGSVESVPAALQVDPVPAAPTIKAQPLSQSVRTGGLVEVSVLAAGVPSVGYQWQISTDAGSSYTSINGATGAQYRVSTASKSSDGSRFRVVITNAEGSVVSEAATLRVLDVPHIEPTAAWNYWRLDAHFIAPATGSDLQYQWQLMSGENREISDVLGATALAYTLPATASPSTTNVCVKVMNAVGSDRACTGLQKLDWYYINPRPTGNNLLTATWTDATTVLAAGEQGTILRSTDAGISWSMVHDARGYPITSMALSGSTGVAVTDEGDVYRSIDGGSHWAPTWRPDNRHWRGVAFSGPNLVVKVGGFEGETVVRTSSDGGATWSNATSDSNIGMLSAVAFNADGVGLAVGQMGLATRSTDGGKTWKKTSLESRGGLYAVAFASNDVALAGGSDGQLWRSIDAGMTWQSVIDATSFGILSIKFSSPLIGIATTSYGTTIRTVDGGLTWSTQEGSPFVSGVMAVAFGPENRAIAVGSIGTILRSNDSGASWIPAIPRASFTLADIAFANASVGLAVGSSGSIIRTQDGGTTWTSSVSPNSNWLTGVAFADALTAVATADDGSVLRSGDSGINWTVVVPSGTGSLTDVAFADSSVGVIGRFDGLLRTTDSGRSWVPVAGVRSTVLSIAFGDSKTGVATTGTGEVLRTTDAGLTWSVVSTGPDVLRTAAFANTSTVVVAGDNRSALRSVDGGLTWQPIETFWQQPSATLRAVRFIDEKNGVMVGSLNALLRTSDGGAHWRWDLNVGGPEFFGVAAVGQHSAIAVGWGGTIYRSDSF